MKRTLVIALFAVMALVTASSCVSSKGGCKQTQGFMGYGARR
jgi:hypothetical protein